MTESDIRRAYVRMREVDQTIPDEVLDFMRDCALEEIKRTEEAHRQKRRDRLDKIRQSDVTAFGEWGQAEKCPECGAVKCPNCGESIVEVEQ